jgi:hypothetical protein
LDFMIGRFFSLAIPLKTSIRRCSFITLGLLSVIISHKIHALSHFLAH